VDRGGRPRSPPGARRAIDAGRRPPDGHAFPRGSDDPGLELLPDALHGQAAAPLLFVAAVGRRAGLAALGEGRADAAACAHAAPDSGDPDLSHIAASLPGAAVVLVNAFVRDLGLVVWTGNPRKIDGVRDLGRRGLRFVNRQPGSSTRAFTDVALSGAEIEPAGVVGYRDEVWTHWAVALRVLRGEADVGVATRAVASALSLGFIPLARERLDLVIPKARFFQPPFQALIEAVRSERFRRGLERLGGYDWGRAGRVVGELA
jgi:putative molybdopterin biosynthesis protein